MLKMRFVQFLHNDRRCLGIENTDGGDIVNLTEADPSLPSDLRTFIEGGESLLTSARRVVENDTYVVSRSNVELLAPITNCEKVLCVGMNYIGQCKQKNAPIPQEPVIFSKFPSCIIGPYSALPYPVETKRLDWEVELVIVIGKEAKKVKENDGHVEAEAMDYIFGYTMANDVSARDWMVKNGGQVLLGKAMDGLCPLGPAVVTKESIADPHNLGIKCKVNGVTTQSSNTSNLIFKSQQIITFLTRFFTLRPGDLVLTGTPPRVGDSVEPVEYLQTGDIVECEIEELGKIITPIV